MAAPDFFASSNRAPEVRGFPDRCLDGRPWTLSELCELERFRVGAERAIKPVAAEGVLHGYFYRTAAGKVRVRLLLASHLVVDANVLGLRRERAVPDAVARAIQKAAPPAAPEAAASPP